MARRSWIVMVVGAVAVLLIAVPLVLFFSGRRSSAAEHRERCHHERCSVDGAAARVHDDAASAADDHRSHGRADDGASPTHRRFAAAGGDWTMDPSGTIAGYRIQEELAGIGGATAVGRTSDVVGSLHLTGATIDRVGITVSMTSLRSDEPRRDNALRSRGLETDDFPEAMFELTAPIDLGALPEVGEIVTATAIGNLTLHGVTREVSVLLEAQFTDRDTIVVVGGLEIALVDYDIEAPVGFSVLSIADVGIFEFQLTFAA